MHTSSLSRGTPVRVMHMVHNLGVGGTELGIAKLVNHLDPTRVASSICSFLPADTIKQTLRSDIALHEFNRRRTGNDPLLVGEVYRLLRKERPHIVHTHRWSTLCEGVIAARLARTPYVIHGEHGTLQTRRFNALVQRWMWKRTAQVLSVSSRLAERMSQDIGFPLSSIRVIRNGVDLDRFNPGHRGTARVELGLPADEVVIGTVGRLVPVKDQATLLRAVAILRDQGLRLRTLVAGAGPLRDQLVAQAQQLDLPLVQFMGTRSDIERVLASLDVFVLSSQSEGLSNTIQEAMATGVPVVATRVGGADELVSDNETGILVPPSDPGAMAGAIRALVADVSRRAQMGIAARRRAESLFGLNRMIRDYETLYLDVAAGGAELVRNARVDVASGV